MPGSGIPRWKCLHTHAPRACSDLQRASNSNCPLMAPPWAHRSLARFPIGCHSHRGPGRFERLLIRRSPIAKSTTIAKMYMGIALPNTKMHMGGQECSHARAQSTHSTLRNQRAALAARRPATPPVRSGLRGTHMHMHMHTRPLAPGDLRNRRLQKVLSRP
jgi:hypothetical protein